MHGYGDAIQAATGSEIDLTTGTTTASGTLMFDILLAQVLVQKIQLHVERVTSQVIVQDILTKNQPSRFFNGKSNIFYLLSKKHHISYV